ncbi:MAG TPA: helix-turn-helix transcriptional regulator [Dehalococcoidia bacterium]|nr:helix-turn-helix transcriptional regulator [Dehalococcoidia bacterium]
MGRLSYAEFAALSDVVGEVYTLTDLSGYPGRVLSLVQRLVPCDIITYEMIDLRTADDTWVAQPPDAIPGELVPVFLRYLDQHPLVAHQQQTGDGRAVKISDFLTRKQFHRLELYNEFFRHFPVEYQMAVGIAIGQGGVVGMGLSRSHPDFSESERLLLNLIRPHLVRAYRNAEIFTLFRQAAGSGGRELVLISRTGEVEFATDRALRWLTSYFGVSGVGASRLPDALQQWVRRWWECLQDGSAISSLPSPCFTMERGDKSLAVYLILGSKTSDHDLLILAERQAGSLASSLMALGLSRREAEILSLVAEGKTNVEIGELVCISPRTVQTHLEKAFAKLGVHTRAAAVKRALELVQGSATH